MFRNLANRYPLICAIGILLSLVLGIGICAVAGRAAGWIIDRQVVEFEGRQVTAEVSGKTIVLPGKGWWIFTDGDRVIQKRYSTGPLIVRVLRDKGIVEYERPPTINETKLWNKLFN